MQVNDPIADLLTRLRNAQKAGHEVVSLPASKMKIAIAHILKDEGLLKREIIESSALSWTFLVLTMKRSEAD